MTRTVHSCHYMHTQGYSEGSSYYPGFLDRGSIFLHIFFSFKNIILCILIWVNNRFMRFQGVLTQNKGREPFDLYNSFKTR